jgi:hypothetical protein
VVKNQTIWIPRADRTLAGANSALRTLNLSVDQIESFDVVPAGREYRKMLISYQESMPPVLLTSDVRNGAWFHHSAPPDQIRLLFNTGLDISTIDSGDFKIYFTGSTHTPDPSTFTLSGQELTIPITYPPNYTGPVTVVGEGFSSIDGVDVKDGVNVGFLVGSVGSSPLSNVNNGLENLLKRGRARVSKLVAVKGQETAMLTQFRRHWAIPDENVIKVVYVGTEVGELLELYMLWYERTGPSLSRISPDPSLVPQEADLRSIFLTFDQPVADLTTSEAVLHAPPGVSYGVVQTTTDRTQWQLTGNFNVAGQYSLRLVGVRDRNGDSISSPDYHSWQVMPTTGNPPPAGPVAFCDSFTGDGVLSTFPLTHEPMDCSWHVFRNGVSQLGCVTVLGTILTFSDGPPASGDRIVFRGWYQP